MKCPSCADSTLVMTDRQGVEIDYCPACRGIWLDRGELDKLLDRASEAATPTKAVHSSRPTEPLRRPDFEDSDYRASSGYQRRRKKSWLDEIFD